jgi:hypothetical protein
MLRKLVLALALTVGAGSLAAAQEVTCKDGTTSKAGRGACSHHGGIAAATARCKDGTMSYAKQHEGACSHHGGVANWLK